MINQAVLSENLANIYMREMHMIKCEDQIAQWLQQVDDGNFNKGFSAAYEICLADDFSIQEGLEDWVSIHFPTLKQLVRQITGTNPAATRDELQLKVMEEEKQRSFQDLQTNVQLDMAT